MFVNILRELSVQEEARRRALAAVRQEAALRARLQTQMKAKASKTAVKEAKDQSTEPPSAKRTKMSKKLETCPGVRKVSSDNLYL